MSRSVDEHAAYVRDLLTFEIETETLLLNDALGRALANAVFSPRDLPLFRNSQMDGFAVRAADVTTVPITLPIVGEVAARAAAPAALQPRTAVKVMTGAVVPDGADAVIPVEDTTLSDGQVTITRGRAQNEYVRDRGSDVAAGDELLPSGRLLAARHLAVLAAAGIPSVDVVRQVRIAVITTGAELREPGEEVEPGQVYDANSTALIAAVRSSGAVVTLAQRVVDEPALLLSVLGEAVGKADLILTSGGISKGDYEVVRELLEPRGAKVEHLAMQPGGPQATAVFDGTPVICFPGNPVSTQLSFEVFVAPILREYAGYPAKRHFEARLSEKLSSIGGKRQFLRGQLQQDGTVQVSSGPGSHLVAGLAAADVLLVLPEAVTSLDQGEMVEVWEL